MYIALLFRAVKEGPPDLVSPCGLVANFDFSTVFIFLAAQLSERYKFFSVLYIKMADLEEILPEVFYLGNFMIKIVLIHLESKVAHSYL